MAEQKIKNDNQIEQIVLEHGFDVFKIFIAQIIEPLGLGSIYNVCIDPEAKQYSGLTFSYKNKKYLFRQAKITPTKVGQFVTLWIRPTKTSEIAPFSVNDEIDGVIIANFDADRRGFFIFDQALLGEKGIFTQNHVEGKRAMRVYAPWVNTASKQASKTQQWQILNFLELDLDKNKDMEMLKKAQVFFA